LFKKGVNRGKRGIKEGYLSVGLKEVSGKRRQLILTGRKGKLWGEKGGKRRIEKGSSILTRGEVCEVS